MVDVGYVQWRLSISHTGFNPVLDAREVCGHFCKTRSTIVSAKSRSPAQAVNIFSHRLYHREGWFEMRLPQVLLDGADLMSNLCDVLNGGPISKRLDRFFGCRHGRGRGSFRYLQLKQHDGKPDDGEEVARKIEVRAKIISKKEIQPHTG